MVETPMLDEEVWSTSLVINLVHSQLLRMSLESVQPSYCGFDISVLDLSTVILLVAKSKLSPDVKNETVTLFMPKYDLVFREAFVISATNAPFLPQTVPFPLSQQKADDQSTPTPQSFLSCTRAGTILPSRPRLSKCVSTKKGSILKPGIIPPLSQYCNPLVPLRVSERPLPLTPPSLTFFWARPTLAAKQRCPQVMPPPQVGEHIIIEPAEVPERMTSLLMAIFCMTAMIALGVPSSLSHDLECLAWSPPLKNTISADLMISKLAWPSAVLRSVVERQLSMWTEMCLGEYPYSSKSDLQEREPTSSTLKASSPSCSDAAADVMTAILGHLVVFQSEVQLLGDGFLPVAAANLVQIYVQLLATAPPMRNTLMASTCSWKRQSATTPASFMKYAVQNYQQYIQCHSMHQPVLTIGCMKSGHPQQKQ